MHDIHNLEGRGIPAMFVASMAFQEATKAQATALGFEPAVVFVPHPIQDRTEEEMRQIAKEALSSILSAMVQDQSST